MILLLIVCLMLPTVLPAEAQADAVRDIPFAERPERKLLMNIHRPEGDGHFPVLLYIYGGSYVSGDRNILSEQGDIINLTEDGVAVVAFDYRHSQEAVFPAQILDVTAALCWLRQHGDADSVVPYQQSVQLQRAYQTLQWPVIFVTVPDGDHGRGGKPGQSFGSRRLFEQTRDFLLLHLGVVGVI